MSGGFWLSNAGQMTGELWLIRAAFIFAAGFFLDMLFGDPLGKIHPVRLVGFFVDHFDSKYYDRYDDPKTQQKKGVFLVVEVLLLTLLFSVGALALGSLLHPALGVIVELFLASAVLSAHDLKKESMRVYAALSENDTERARWAVSRIVGRDTERLTEKGIIKATVETVAENASDGEIAPLFYLFLGGPVLAMLYKAVNTMDSMIGYQNERYYDFGRAAAKLDDIVNFIPARLSAMFFIATVSCLSLFETIHRRLHKELLFTPRIYDVKNAVRIYLRDRKKHESPNAAQTESVCAGALRIALLGDAYYFGERKRKPVIGEPLRPVEPEDIRRANRIMYGASWIAFLVFFMLRVAVILWMLRGLV